MPYLILMRKFDFDYTNEIFIEDFVIFLPTFQSVSKYVEIKERVIDEHLCGGEAIIMKSILIFWQFALIYPNYPFVYYYNYLNLRGSSLR